MKLFNIVMKTRKRERENGDVLNLSSGYQWGTGAPRHVGREHFEYRAAAHLLRDV